MLLEYLKRSREGIAYFDKVFNYQDWKVIQDDKKEGLIIWQRTTDSGLNSVKAAGIVNRSPM